MNDSQSLKILVADDTDLNRSMVAKLLTRKGHRVVAVEDGLQAFDTFRQGEFDVILMDVQMPVMDGMEATRQIRAWEKAETRPPVPIIALTANDERKDREQFLSSGMDSVIVKPLDVKILLPTLQEIIQRQAATPRRTS
jgi:CheY-like chemotaxis protein